MSNEERQIVDFVARGRYPIAIGPSGTLTFQLKAQGVPVELYGSAGLQEGGFVPGDLQRKVRPTEKRIADFINTALQR